MANVCLKIEKNGQETSSLQEQMWSSAKISQRSHNRHQFAKGLIPSLTQYLQLFPPLSFPINNSCFLFQELIVTRWVSSRERSEQEEF